LLQKQPLATGARGIIYPHPVTANQSLVRPQLRKTRKPFRWQPYYPNSLSARRAPSIPSNAVLDFSIISNAALDFYCDWLGVDTRKSVSAPWPNRFQPELAVAHKPKLSMPESKKDTTYFVACNRNIKAAKLFLPIDRVQYASLIL
jgi:hypothetical protein